MTEKLDDKINAVEAFVNDSDEHPEITLAMFRRQLDDLRLKADELLTSFRQDGDAILNLHREGLILGRGLAALVGRCLGCFDEDTWRDHLMDVSEHRDIEARRLREGRCLRCGDPVGERDGVCPECGYQPDEDTWDYHLRDLAVADFDREEARGKRQLEAQEAERADDENPDLIAGSW